MTKPTLTQDYWQKTPIIDPTIWPHYWHFKALKCGGRALEIGPGLTPRLAFDDSNEFLEINPTVVERLAKLGARVREGSLNQAPYDDSSFDLICAFSSLSSLDDDESALREIQRLLKLNGKLILSVPLQAKLMSFQDELWGCKRRYEPASLISLFSSAGFTVRGVLPLNTWFYQVVRFFENQAYKYWQETPQRFHEVRQDLLVPQVKLHHLLSPGRGRSWLKNDFENILRQASEAVMLCVPSFEVQND